LLVAVLLDDGGSHGCGRGIDWRLIEHNNKAPLLGAFYFM